MLKPISFRERMGQVEKDMEVVNLISSVAGLLGIAFMIRQEPGIWTLLLWIVIYGVTVFLSSIAWILMTLWLGRVPLWAGLHGFAHGDKHPKFAQYFLETWWNNEFTLKVFVGVLRLALGIGIYRVLAPMLGMQGWQTISGAG